MLVDEAQMGHAVSVESVFCMVWYEENAHIPGCFHGAGMVGVGKESLASQGWAAEKERQHADRVAFINSE